MTKNILLVSKSSAPLAHPIALLRELGYEVGAAHNLFEVNAYCKWKGTDLVIISHRMPTAEKRRIAAAVRGHCPEAKILVLRRGAEESLQEFAHVIDGLEGPAGFMQAVETALAA